MDKVIRTISPIDMQEERQPYKKYYNQTQIWGKAPSKKEVKRAKFICNRVPEDVQTILDVGCGDGTITNILAKNYDVTGLDISKEALKYVRAPKVIGNCAALPFPDSSFDLVLASEVLEHLPLGVFERTLAELERVSKKYILISVPYNENLREYYTKCERCDNVFHVWGHLRSFTPQDVRGLFRNVVVRNTERIKGDQRRYNKILLFIRQRVLNYWAYDEHAVCPHCGAHPVVPQIGFIRRIILIGLNLLNMCINPSKNHGGWIVSLFEKQE